MGTMTTEKLSKEDAYLKKRFLKLDAENKELAANQAALGKERAQLSAREAESEKASRLAARQTLDAQRALKANQERERSARIAERKALASEQRLAEAKKAKDELGTRELEEARKLLQVRDRTIADQQKEVQRLQASLRSASEALRRRQIELTTEVARAKAQTEAQGKKTKALQIELGTARTSSAKATDLAARESQFRKAKAELESQEKQLVQGQTDLDSKMKLFQRANNEFIRRQAELAN